MFQWASDLDEGFDATFTRKSGTRGRGPRPRHYYDHQSPERNGPSWLLERQHVQKCVTDIDSMPASLNSPQRFTSPSVSNLIPFCPRFRVFTIERPNKLLMKTLRTAGINAQPLIKTAGLFHRMSEGS